MRIVGLTGGVATGKSTVSKVLKQHGIRVIDCDQLARKVLSSQSILYRPFRARVANIFPSAMKSDGSLDRAEIAHIVFHDPTRRKQLNRATHPFVAIMLLGELIRAYLSLEPVITVEMALLFEVQLHRMCTEVVVCDAGGEDVQIRRVMARDHTSEEAAAAKVHSQMPSSEKVKRATTVISTGDDSSSMSLDESVSSVAARTRRYRLVDVLLLPPVVLIGVALAVRQMIVR